MRACFEPVFENFPQIIDSYKLLKFFNFKKNLVTNYFPVSIVEAKAFIQNILEKFSQISVLGALEDEEIDSLEHLALFHEDKLLTCSPCWDSKIHEVDKTLLYLEHQIWLKKGSKER
jgi:hypothetical protein